MHATSPEEIAEALDRFIRERFQVTSEDVYFTRETDLWSEGYLDSLGIVEMIAFLENTFLVSIPEEALFDSGFACINGMAKLTYDLCDYRASPEERPVHAGK